MLRKYDMIKIAALALACSAISHGAFAQVNAAPAAKDASQKQEPGEVPGNQPRIDWTKNESLVLQGLAAKHLPDSGFTPTVSWAGEQYSNISGGISSGTKWDSLFTLGFEQDFSKLAQKDGLGSFGITAFYYTASGDFDGENLGALSSPSNIFSGEMMRVFEIFYTNSVETEYGTFGFRAGQLAADEDFMGLDYADIFLNSNFGAIPAIAGNALANGANAFSQYALATLGGTIFWQNEKFDAIIGIYNGNCGEDLPGNHGFGYELQDVALWYQVGANYELAGLGGRAQFGGNWHSGNFNNYTFGGESENFYSFYIGIEQALLADAEGKAVLGAFCRLAWAPNEEIADITKYVDAGLNWFAPIPGRDDDIFAVGFSAMETGSGFRNSEGVRRYDTMMEATYRIQITKAIAFQPTFQIYFNTPQDNSVETDVAYVVGARLEVNF